MKNNLQQSKKSRACLPARQGFTLIESLVLLFIFSVVSMVFLQVYVVGTKLIIDSKNRLGAVALANQKMEIIRSIDYETIGTKYWNGSGWVYGIPAGDILQEEDISVNTRLYHVSTFVQYVDDVFDNKSPTDTIPTDYKRVRVQVSWGNAASEKTILFGSFTPNGLEMAVAGGTLSVNVLRSNGSGVVGATVNVRNTAGTINVNAITDATGNVTLPGTPAGSRAYTITVSKSGYFGANTFPPYPTTSYQPVDIHASVVINTLNQFSIVMDEAVSIPIKMVSPYDQSLPDITFNLAGGRVLGTIPTTLVKVVTLNDANRATNSNGEYTYSNQSYGLYTLALTGTSNTNYEVYKILPETGSVASGMDITPGSTQEYKVVLLDKNIPSVKVAVTDNATSTPIAGATVRLQNSDSTYDVTGTTDQFGFTFFPENSTPLVAGSYTLSVSASGYINKSAAVTVGTTLVKQTISLTK